MALADLGDADREVALDLLTALADDEYLHGDRLSGWLTIAPTLEEDNVLTSVAQDEMGHARLWYELVAEHRGGSVDDLAIGRPADARRNSALVERELDGFADTVVRSFLYDRYERLVLEALAAGEHRDLVDRADLALGEEAFHREHAEEWLAVFETLETDRDRERVREAVETNLVHAGDLFSFDGAGDLLEAGVVGTPLGELRAEWEAATLPALAAQPVGLTEDELVERVGGDGPNGRAGEHTDDLADLVASMQPRELERLDV